MTGRATAIQIMGCFQVVVSNILVSNSSQGLTFVDTLSSVEVTDSQFISNTIANEQNWPGGGGLQILFISHEESFFTNGANYTIARNIFADNMASSSAQEAFQAEHAGRGGGVRILLFNKCKNLHVVVDSNVMYGNKAVFGGGLLVYLSGNASSNNIIVSNNNFTGNIAKAGGGGAEFGYSTFNYSYSNEYPSQNNLSTFNSSFIDNNASFGGGMSLFAASVSFFSKHSLNNYTCGSCHFENNSALDGAAVNVVVQTFKINGAQYLTAVWFSICSFIGNKIEDDTKSNGAVYVSLVLITFRGTTLFANNKGTALYMESVEVKIDDSSHMVFQNNFGYQGGAIHMFGNSRIHVCKNSCLYFLNNTAVMYGGAINVGTSQPHTFSFIEVCFLRVGGLETENVTYYFQGNKAKIGNDIFATTIAPCAALCQYYSCSTVWNVINFLQESCLGTFNFSSGAMTTHVATSPKNLTKSGDSQLMTITPGFRTQLDITQTDELGQIN